MAPDPAGVVALAAAASGALAFAVLAAFAGRGRPTRAVPQAARWELRFPREAGFSVPQAAEWFAALAPRLDASSPVCVDLRGAAGQVRLGIAADPDLEPFLRVQLAAWFPEARLEAAPEPAPGSVAFVALRLERSEILPVRVPGPRDPDPLPGLAAVLAEGSDAGVRLVLAPPPANWTPWAAAALDALRQGASPPGRGLLFRVQSFFGASAGDGAPGRAARRPGLAGAAAKAVAPAFSVRALAWVSGAAPEAALGRALAIAAHLRAAYADPSGNAFAPAGPLPGSLEDALRRCPAVTLSAAELAALFHVPPGGHPLLAAEPSRVAHPSPELLDRAAGDGAIVLGEALAPGGPVPFGLTPEERRLHLYVVGKTGTGKSTLLANILRQDLEAGRGVALLDPHGDLALQALSLVPPGRHREVVYFDPGDREFPVGYNPLAGVAPAARPLAASGMVAVFRKLWGDSWGPRLEHLLRMALLALLDAPFPSLLLLPRLLGDRETRARVLAHVQDPLVRGYFLDEYERYDPRWRAEAAAPVLNKVGQFLASPLVRNVVGQAEPGLNLRELMDSGGIFVANLAAGRIGEDSAALLGGLLVAGFQLAAMSRADVPEPDRRDFFLTVDEFQHFATDAFASVLSEARKYRLALTLSHQYLDQLTPAVSDAVFGNAGHLAVFRVGQGDTGRLVRELAPSFDAQDLVHLDAYRFCARITRAGRALPAFSARTVALPYTDFDGSPEAVVGLSRRRWGRPRAEVELEISDLWEGRLN